MSSWNIDRRDLLLLAGSGVLAAGVSNSAQAADEAAESELSYGDRVKGSLSEDSPFDEDYNGYHETYTFEGEEDDLISIEMRPDTEAGVTDEERACQIRVYDPNNERIVYKEPSGFGYGATGQDRIQLEDTGTYTVIATTAGYSRNIDPYRSRSDTYQDTFDYELRLHEFVGTPDEVLSYNESISGTIAQTSNYTTSLNGYYDVYAFEAEENDVISIEMRPDTEAGVADEERACQIRVYDPNNERIVYEEPSGFGYGATGQDRIQLEDTGTYTVIATTAGYSRNIDPYRSRSDSHHDTFDYELRLHEFVGAPEEILSYGDLTTGSLSGESNYQIGINGYYNVYSFEGKEGSRISIEMRPDTEAGATDDEHACQIRVYDPDNERIVYEEPSGLGYGAIGQDRIQLEETGTYTVIATTAGYSQNIDPYRSRSDSYHDTFSYDIRVYELPRNADQIDVGAEITDRISQDSFYRSEDSGLHNIYKFDGTEGQRISTEMRVSIPTEQAAQLRLYDPEGDFVSSGATDQGNAQLDRVELEMDGKHTLIATTNEDADVYDSRAEAYADTFEYVLRFYEFVGERQLVIDGDEVESQLETTDNFQDGLNGYYDAYVTTAMEGDTLAAEMVIDQEEENTAQLMLFGPDETTVTSSDTDLGGASVERTVEENGIYTLVATTEDQFTSDAYDTEEDAKEATFRYQLSFSGPENAPPLVDEVSVNPARAPPGYDVGLAVDASDPNGDELEYEWEQFIGSFPDPEVEIRSPGSASATFEAPETDSKTELTFEVTVSDTNGGSITYSINMIVDPDAEPPSDAAFALGSLGTNSPIEAGETLEVSADVTNNGTESGTETIELQDPSGTAVDSTDLELASGATESITLRWEGTSGSTGTSTVTVSVAETTATASVKIESEQSDDEHPSGVSQEVWDAVTGQNEPTDELTFGDLVDAIQAYQNDEPIDGTNVTFGNLVDLIQWYQE